MSRSCIGALSHLWFSHMQVDTCHSWHTDAELAQGSRGVSWSLHPHFIVQEKGGSERGAASWKHVGLPGRPGSLNSDAEIQMTSSTGDY